MVRQIAVLVLAVVGLLLPLGARAATAPVDELLVALTRDATRDDAAAALARLLSDDPGSASRADPVRAGQAVTSLFRRLDPLVGKGRAVCGSWSERGPYPSLRFAAELAIDVAGRVEATGSVNRALRSSDPYLAAWGVVAARRLGLPVSNGLVSRLATDDLARSVIELSADDWRRAVPSRYATIEAHARAAMVRWLVYPTELGCQPVSIGAIGRFRLERGTYVVFRFRDGGARPMKGGAYLAGVAGPFDGEGALALQSETFSDFERVGTTSAAKHLERITGLIVRAHAKNAKA